MADDFPSRRAADRVLDEIQYQLRAFGPVVGQSATNVANIESLRRDHDRLREDIQRWIDELKADSHSDLEGVEKRLVAKIQTVSLRCDTFHEDWAKTQERSALKTVAWIGAAAGIIAACVTAAAMLFGGG